MQWTMLGICLLASTAEAAGKGDVRHAWISAPIEVSANGEPTIGRVEGIDEKASARVADFLARRRYLPAERDGGPVSASAQLTAKLVLTPSEDSYAATLEDLHVGPRVERLVPPRYPSAMLQKRKSGYVELRLAVSENGAIAQMETVATSDKAFDSAAREALRKTRFEPIRIEGAPVATDVSALVLFRLEREPVPSYAPACAIDRRQPRSEGQNGCMSTIEVTAQRVGASPIHRGSDSNLAIR
jgi:TonB family protein